MWYVVARIDGYRILEGAGPHGGWWAVAGRGEWIKFKSRREAEEHATFSGDDR